MPADGADKYLRGREGWGLHGLCLKNRALQKQNALKVNNDNEQIRISQLISPIENQSKSWTWGEPRRRLMNLILLVANKPRGETDFEDANFNGKEEEKIVHIKVLYVWLKGLFEQVRGGIRFQAFPNSIRTLQYRHFLQDKVTIYPWNVFETMFALWTISTWCMKGTITKLIIALSLSFFSPVWNNSPPFQHD